MQKLEALFDKLHNMTDVVEVVRVSAEHEVNFLPPEANEWFSDFQVLITSYHQPSLRATGSAQGAVR